GIPAVVGLRTATQQLKGGEVAILDGAAGTLWIHPTEAEVEAHRARARREEALTSALAEMTGAEPVTADGVRIVLRANVDIPEEAVAAVSSGADGVGLMRTEFLVIGRTAMPEEDEQYRAYRRVLEPVGGYPTEANPFLGWRAIRMCLDQPDMFRTQLRAMLRAAVHGDLRIMLPL